MGLRYPDFTVVPAMAEAALAPLRERLSLLYGAGASLALADLDGGASAVLCFPAQQLADD